MATHRSLIKDLQGSNILFKTRQTLNENKSFLTDSDI